MHHADRNYRLAQLLLLVAGISACFCLDRMVTYGLGDPNKAKFWFSILVVSLALGIIASLASYYYRAKRNHSSREEIAMQALAAAGSSLAKATAPSAAPVPASGNHQPKNTSSAPKNHPPRSAA